MSLGHLGDLALRRVRAGELQDGHAEACPECRARMQALEEEHQRFHQDISFERFAAGVERAARQAPKRRSTWIPTVMGMAVAAGLAGLVTSSPLLRPESRTKGERVMLRISGPLGGPQRFASQDSPEPLYPGERVRIGYRPGSRHFVAAISVDETGDVTPLYPQFGTSLPADEGEATYYLPESLEFTGKGAETVVVVLSDQPLEVGDLTRAARRAFDAAHGDVRHLGNLSVPGEQFHRVFLKP